MALIAPNIVRYTINGTYLGRPTANIMDMYVEDETGVGTREDRIPQVADILQGAWDQHILPNQSSSFTAVSVSWVDLNSEDGVIGTVSSGAGGVWPAPGETGGNPYTGAVACLITKAATARRGQRQGRMFLPGLTEAYVSGNEIDSTYLNDLQPALDLFVNQITYSDLAPFEGFWPVVVHTRNDGTPTNPVIVFTGASRVEEMSAQVRVASQRRRNRP